MEGIDLEWTSSPFTDLSQEAREELRNIVNEANRVRPRIFPGDRLDPDTLATNYADCTVVTLRHDNQLIACEFLRPNEEALWLLLLAVSPTHQGQGFGPKLIERAVTFARENQAALIRLQAVGEPLINFYLKNGFQVELQETMPVGQWGSPHPFELTTMSRSISSRAR